MKFKLAIAALTAVGLAGAAMADTATNARRRKASVANFIVRVCGAGAVLGGLFGVWDRRIL